MGQSAAKASQDFSFTAERDSFKRKALLLFPPPNVQQFASSDLSSDERSGAPIATLRLLRSMMVSVWSWDGEPLLAEQWGTVLSGHDAVVCFLPRLVQTRKQQHPSAVWDFTHADDVQLAAEVVHTYPPDRLLKYHVETALRRVQAGSEDAIFLLAIVDVPPPPEYSAPDEAYEALKTWADYYWYDPEAEEAKRKKAALTEGDHASDDDEDRRAESVDPNELLRLRAEAIKASDITKRRADRFLEQLKQDFRALWTELPACPLAAAEYGFLSECLLSPAMTPIDLARPLCSLLDQLRESCEATCAFLLDSVSLLPLIDTLVPGSCSTATHIVHRTLWAMRRTIESLRQNLQSGLHLTSIQLSDGTLLHLGWACRPYAMVLLVCRAKGTANVQRRVGEEVTFARSGPLLLESNLSYFAMHFSNVIYNKTLTRDYRPIAA